MFKNDEDKTRKLNVEMSLEQLEFIHYVVSLIRDKLYNPNYYYSRINQNERNRDYNKCNDILVLLVKAHEKVKED
jgi:hypothetical protein